MTPDADVAHPDTIRGPIEEEYNALREGIETQFVADRKALEAKREADLTANEAAKSAALVAVGLNGDGSVPGDWPETADPENTASPTITGDNAVDVELTADPGTWTHSPAFGYQWERGDFGGPGVVTIDGATAVKYTLQDEDAGKRIRVRVTGTNSFGHHVALSDWTDQIEPLNLTLPTISGTETVGEELTATPGTWSGEDSTVYQWGVADDDQGLNAVDIDGEQELTYTIVAADQGKYIRFLESAYNDGGDTTVSSVYHGPVAGA